MQKLRPLTSLSHIILSTRFCKVVIRSSMCKTGLPNICNGVQMRWNNA